MLTSTEEMLQMAQRGGYAIGAFNVYNLEGVRAVVNAAEAEFSPAILQLHPASLRHGGKPLVEMCLSAARSTFIPMSVHLDHSESADDIQMAIEAGLLSIMADGSNMPYDENVAYTGGVSALVHSKGGTVEAELGRLSGTEDNLTVAESLAKLTDPEQAVDFTQRTGIDALAICIGNVHGRYHSEPNLDFQRLADINVRLAIPLVLHGASGLPEEMVRRSIELGICKFNVNTEVRNAYLNTLKERLNEPSSPDLLDLMQSAIKAMQTVVAEKIRLFGANGKV